MRFFCEWCHERVDIKDHAAPRAEVLAHFFRCSHRPSAATNTHIEGLATHIAGLLGDNMEFVLKVRRALAG
jgi:hypothetical protein